MNEPIHEQKLNLDVIFKHVNPRLNPMKKKASMKDSCSIKRDEVIWKGKARGGRGGCQTKKEIKKLKPYLTSSKLLNPNSYIQITI
jgi:hypothetical protein